MNERAEKVRSSRFLLAFEPWVLRLWQLAKVCFQHEVFPPRMLKGALRIQKRIFCLIFIINGMLLFCLVLLLLLIIAARFVIHI